MTPVIPEEALNQHTAAVGKTGSGKTYMVKSTIVEPLLGAGRRVCIIDPTGAWWGLRSSADGKRAGFPVVVFGGLHSDVPIVAGSGPALAQLVAERNLPCVIDLSEMLIGHRHTFMTDFAETIYRLNRAPLHLVIDEADEFCPQNPMPETKRLLHHVDRLVRRGRIRGFMVVLITQRPAVINKNVLTQANTLVAMRLPAPQDRKAIEGWIQGQADADQGREVLASLSKLQRGEGWVWSPEHGLLKRIAFPPITTFDSGRTPGHGEQIAAPARLASVDLDAVRSGLADAAREAEANDPKALRRRIGELEKQLKTQQPEAPDLDKLHDMAYAEGHVDGHAEGRRLGRALALPEGFALGLAAAKSALAQIKPPEAVPTNQAGVVQRPEQRVSNPRVAGSSPAARSTAPAAKPSFTPKSALSGPQRKILDALAWWAAVRVPQPTRVQVAMVAGYSPGGGSFSNTLGSLRTAGLIDYPAGGTISLTPAGAGHARQPDAIPTTEQLHAQVMALLDGPRRRILQPLLDAYPNSLPREDVAARAGYEAEGGSFSNNLGALRSMGLIDYPGRGLCRALSILFVEQ